MEHTVGEPVGSGDCELLVVREGVLERLGDAVPDPDARPVRDASTVMTVGVCATDALSDTLAAALVLWEVVTVPETRLETLARFVMRVPDADCDGESEDASDALADCDALGE